MSGEIVHARVPVFLSSSGPSIGKSAEDWIRSCQALTPMGLAAVLTNKDVSFRVNDMAHSLKYARAHRARSRSATDLVATPS